MDLADPDAFDILGDHLNNTAERSFYFALPPEIFAATCANLQRSNIINDSSRVVLEKPLGLDKASAIAINDAVANVFPEANIYRIDHYLGKETVQNLLALRFSNLMFEPLWNNMGVDHVQITVSETVGAQGRWKFYDRAGALRDMVQNHILQLLCLVAMEPPASYTADAVRDEKLKVLKALHPIGPANIRTHSVRGHYSSGVCDTEQVPGYLNEDDSEGHSATETYVALKVGINNWRWSGVPFYLRTGKRLRQQYSEIVIYFRKLSHSICPSAPHGPEANKLIIRLQPEEHIQLMMNNKVPGMGNMQLCSVPLNLSLAEAFQHRRSMEAYERLLIDTLKGNPTLFMRRDEVETAWDWIDPIINTWNDSGIAPLEYPAGSWGPTAGIELIARDGRSWHESH